MQELIRAVRVGMRTEHAGDQELRLGEFLAQHAHERDAAALAHVGSRRAEVMLRGVGHRLLQPRRQRRRVPARAVLLQGERDLGAVGRVLLQQLLDELAGLGAVQSGRHAQAQLHRGERTQHIAGALQRRDAADAGDCQLRTPGAVQYQLGQVFRDRLHALGPGEFVVDVRAQHLGGELGLVDALLRNVDVQLLRLDRAGGRVLQPRQQLAQDAEAGRHHAGSVARVHALFQHLHAEVAAGHAAQ